jgi:uncharacterized membrane protein YebE (DUF533 family)
MRVREGGPIRLTLDTDPALLQNSVQPPVWVDCLLIPSPLIEVDTERERQYMAILASRLGLDESTVAQIQRSLEGA